MNTNDLHNKIKSDLIEAQKVLNDFIQNEDNINLIASAAELMVNSIKQGGKIFSCGNGGSHCDAMHFAEELTGRYRNNRQALPAIAISDPSHISCVSNDYGYEYVFSRFIEGLGSNKDCLLGISTSGNSKNIINAVNVAKERGIKTIVLTGKDGGKLKDLADLVICVPFFGYADRIQEIHIKIIHILIRMIEELMDLA